MTLSRNSIWIKFLAVLLVVSLVLTFVLPSPHANAVALVDDALLLAGGAVALMIAAGVYFTSQNASTDDFGNFISSKIDQFISVEGSGSVAEYASGISLNPSGVGLNVTDPTMRFLDRFFNWFKDDNALSDTVTELDSSSYYTSGDVRLSSASFSGYPDGTLIVPGKSYSFANGVLTSSCNNDDTTSQFLLSFNNSVINSITFSAPGYDLVGFFIIPSHFIHSSRFYYKVGYVYSGSDGQYTVWPDKSGTGEFFSKSFFTTHSISSSYVANPAYTYSNTQTGSVPFIIVIDETAAGGSGGNGNKHDTARDAAISALQLGLAGKLLSSVTDPSADPGEGGGSSDVSSDVSGIRAAVNSIKNWLDTGFKAFSDVCTEFFTDVRLFFADFWTNFTTKLKEVFKTSLDAIQELLSNIKAGISSAADAVKTAIASAADTICGKIDSIATKISDWWEEWRSSKNDKPTPGFGSGFNSIWHYVVEWLSYISGFVSVVLNVWSVLPYGMVVPVYACIVLVLYFGLYRKFIK